MNRRFFTLAIACFVLLQSSAFAQSDDPPKFEVGAEFTTLEREALGAKRTEPGVGGRFTFNFNRSVAFETAGYFFPNQCGFCNADGTITQVVAGVKVGKRFDTWGIFAKVRPGVVSFSRGDVNPRLTPGGPFPFEFETKRLMNFATDFGGVLEFYPSRRIVTRFDLGDTIVHFGQRRTNAVGFNPTTGEVFLVPVTRPARTTHNFQFSAGVGFRF